MSDHVALIRLSWPDSKLWPHANGHWRPKARATKSYRNQAFVLAKQQSVDRIESKAPILRFSFSPNKRGRLPDIHNMPATMKAAIDGIADAMGCDDAGFRCEWPEEFSERVDGGSVVIEVSG